MLDDDDDDDDDGVASECRLDHCRFLPHPLQFTTLQSSYHSALYNMT